MDKQAIALAQHDPYTIYAYKNTNLEIVRCNQAFLRYSGLSSMTAAVGLTDKDLAWRSMAPVYERHERQALEGLQYTMIAPLIDCRRQFLIFSITKIIELDDCQRVIGLHSLASEIISAERFLFSNADTDKLSHKLTNKEFICLFYLIRGKTAKQIARNLGNSFRTIEKHIVSLKAKLNCHSREELISTAAHQGLFKLNINIPRQV